MEESEEDIMRRSFLLSIPEEFRDIIDDLAQGTDDYYGAIEELVNEFEPAFRRYEERIREELKEELER